MASLLGGALSCVLLLCPTFASATVYSLPGSLPPGCSASSSSSYTCPNLSLAWNDSIVVVNANTTLTVTNTLTANGNSFNTGSTSGFSIKAKTVSGNNYLILNGDLSATNNLTLSSNSNSITGNVSAGGTTRVGGKITGSLTTDGALTTEWEVNIGGDVSALSVASSGGSTYGGSLTATGGSISLGSSETIKGAITATGNVTSGSANTITGNVTSSGGYVILNSANTTVGGHVTASGDVTLSSSASVSGNVISSGGDVTLKSENATVGGSVSAWGQVILQSGTHVVGSVTSNNSAVQLYSSSASVGKCITVDSSSWIMLGWNASAGGVCCDNGGSCGTSCVINWSGNTMPSTCAASVTCSSYGPSSATLDSSLWNAQAVSGGFTPTVVDVSGQKRFRLTSNGTNQSTLLQLKKWFPAAGNKIVVTFDYYVYGGSGADGIAVVLSDPTTALSAGAYGGSLGYAQKTGINGFGGGWLAVGLDEYGAFANASEGRSGYPSGWSAPSGADSAATQRANAVSVRGSGSGTTGYALLASTDALSPPLWKKNSNSSSTHQTFRITVDHSNSVNAYVTVERDSSGGGSSFSTVVPRFDAKASKSGQAAVPQNWLLSFTGATGDNTNYHEIANLSVCATYVNNPGGSTAATNFECLETSALPTWSTSERKPLYTKLVDSGFRFDVVALKSDGSIEGDYVGNGADAKSVTVELFDDSAESTPACSAYANPVASQSLSFAASDAGRKTLAGDFKLSSAYRKLRCRVSDATIPATPVYGCSSDRFAVRPSAATLVTDKTMASGPSASASPKFKAGDSDSDKFSLRATTSTASASYAGTLTLDTGKLTAQTTAQDTSVASGGVVGSLTPTTLKANAALVDATYSEVGYLYLVAGAYRDETFTSVDRADGDCISSTSSDDNLADTLVGGKYGCDIGNKSAVTLGRFIPHHFVVTPGSLVNRRVAACTPASEFGYEDEEILLKDFTLTAYNGLATPGITRNYSGVFAARFVGGAIANFNIGAVDLADTTVPKAATAFAVGSAAGELGLVSSSGSWGDGTGIGTFSAIVKLNRAASPDGPYESFRLGVAPVDLDGVTVLATAKNLDLTAPADGVSDKVLVGSSKLRFGRLRLSNAFGSDRRNLSVPVEAQYWSGLSWVRNSADSCTMLPVAAIKLSGGQGNTKVASEVKLSAGSGSIELSCPYATCPLTSKPPTPLAGSVGVCVDLGDDPTPGVACSATSAALPYLQGRWPPGTGYDNDPAARATFGVYSPETQKTVHIRELY